MCGVDGRRVCCGVRVRVCVCRQDPCAGGCRWIEVTGATVSCRCCSYRTHGALQTLVLHRGSKKRQIKIIESVEEKMEELKSKRALKRKVRGDKKKEKSEPMRF